MRNMVSFDPVSTASKVALEDYKRYFGLLTSPRVSLTTRRIEQAVALGVPWAADNDAYGYWKRGELYNPKPLLKALESWRAYNQQCVFVVAPDVLTNAKATLQNFWYWRDIIRAYGYPVAFAVQDGIEKYPPPWGYFEVLFIGATNRVKYSDHVRNLVQEAKGRGLWVHNGRVNTPFYISRSYEMGCDSFDGTLFSRVNYEVVRVLPYHRGDVLQQRLF